MCNFRKKSLKIKDLVLLKPEKSRKAEAFRDEKLIVRFQLDSRDRWWWPDLRGSQRR